jgi:hypothetical protein
MGLFLALLIGMVGYTIPVMPVRRQYQSPVLLITTLC